MAVSVNDRATKLIEWGMEHREQLGIIVEKQDTGATVIDLGVKARGGFLAGKFMTEICLADLGKASIAQMAYEDIFLPTIQVETDNPAIATLGAQFAGWQIKTAKYFAMGSGPARALALKPKELYQKIDYEDRSDKAVIVLEADSLPDAEALEYVSKECEVAVQNVYALVAPTSSMAGSIQISGRVVEAGIHKLTEIGFDPKLIRYGQGSAPIAPIHPKSAKAMGRTNDAIFYGGIVFYSVDFDDDAKLKEYVAKAPASTSRDYGKPFYETFKAAGFDFYKIDPNLFAPAVFAVNNLRTGTTHTAGRLNIQVLKQTMGITPS